MQSSEPVLRTVRLYGHLARDIGKTIELAFNAPAGALRLLELNFPGFLQRFKQGKYHVSVIREGSEYELSSEQLMNGFTGSELRIMPRATGRGKGKSILTAIVGGLIIGAAFFFSGGTLATALPGVFGATGATFGTLASLGTGLVLSGIGSLLTPTPKTDYQEEQLKSYIFNGPVNVTDQGGVMPLVFGKMMTGSIVLSAALGVEDTNDSSDADGQEVKKPSVHIQTPSQQTLKRPSLAMSDLVKLTSGAALTKLNGVAVTGNGSVTVGRFTLRYYPAGLTDPFYQDAGERTPFYGRKNVIYVDWVPVNTFRPAPESAKVPFEITYNGKIYEGTIIVTAKNFTESGSANN